MRHVEGISGFYGASSIERIPVERALVDATSRFRTLHIAPRPDAV
ncbi:phosphoenolpyruvate hydrolase family protein [Lawsonibacter hominis]